MMKTIGIILIVAMATNALDYPNPSIDERSVPIPWCGTKVWNHVI